MPDLATATLDDVVARVRALVGVADDRPVLVGIDGRGGAGKSTLATAVASRIADAHVVHLDDLYRSNAQRHAAPNGVGSGYDRPRIVEQVLVPLRAGRSTRYQRYDWTLDALDDWIAIDDATVVLVEGVTAIADDLAAHYDLSIWVDTPAATCLARGVERDGEAMRSQWADVWLPGDDAYAAAQAPHARADLLVSGLPA